MNCQSKIAVSPHRNASLALDSTLIEKALEYQLAGSIMAQLIARGQGYEVLHSICDRDGYDIVIEAGGVMRHIQLKSIVKRGKNAGFNLHGRLAQKPSGCAIVIQWDQATVAPIGFRFFGGSPGEPLPDLGSKLGRHSRANSLGNKGDRPAHREVPISRFRPVADVAELVTFLFGAAPDRSREILLAHMVDIPTGPAELWLDAARLGNFSAIPPDLGWAKSEGLAYLIDGYALIEELGHASADAFLHEQRIGAQAGGAWSGNAAELWATLFLEHRHWRFADPYEPDVEQRALLDQLVTQLVEALAR
mgnify:CR=1 FL=1